MEETLKTSLFLDDTRTPKQPAPGFMPWKVVRNFDQFTEIIFKFHSLFGKLPDLISFDHDLHDEHLIDYTTYEAQGIPAIHYDEFKEKTGFECAAWLCDFCELNDLELPLCGVHSQRPLGAKNIHELLNRFKASRGQVPDAYIQQVPSFTAHELGERLAGN